MKDRKQRWLDFMSFEKPSGHLFQIDLDYNCSPPIPNPDKTRERIEWALLMYNHYQDQLDWLMDDRIPCLHIYSGTEIFAEAFGCYVHRPDDNMPYALPLIKSAAEADKLKIPELSLSTLANLFEIADELHKRAGKDAIFHLPDIQSPLDIAALIWEKSEFYIALLEEPEAVHELLHKIKTLIIAFLDEWFERYGREFIAHYPYYYMNVGITLSEDEVGAINSHMFDEFCLPDLKELSKRYGGIGMHCCANAKHQWTNFLKIPDLKLLNIVQPDKITKDAYKFFSAHTCQMHYWCGDGDLSTWPSQYPDDSRVVITAKAADKAQAMQISEKLMRVCSR